MHEDKNDSKEPKKIANKKELSFKEKVIENIALFVMVLIASVLLAVVLISPFYLMREMQNDDILDENKNKKVLFKIDNTRFICTESLLKGSKAHIVSDRKGWSVYGEYFKKDDLLFSISNCEVDDTTLKKEQ